MNKKAFSFVEILAVIFLLLLLSTFFSVKLFRRKETLENKKTLEWISHIFSMTKHRSQSENRDIYLCFVPQNTVHQKSPYLKKNLHLLNHALVLAVKKANKFEAISPWFLSPKKLTFTQFLGSLKKALPFESEEKITIYFKDSLNALFSLKLPAVAFLKRSGALQYPPRHNGPSKKLLIAPAEESSSFLIDPSQNRTFWQRRDF